MNIEIVNRYRWIRDNEQRVERGIQFLTIRDNEQRVERGIQFVTNELLDRLTLKWRSLLNIRKRDTF